MARVSTQQLQAQAPERIDWRVMQPLYTDDGVPLHVRHWGLGRDARPKGSILLVHGLGEHIGRYDTLAADLNAEGWHVCGYDHRGHGASGGARGRIPRDDSLLRDLSRVIDQLREAIDGPLVLLGHSMGGLVAARFVAEGVADPLNVPSWHRRVDALVLSSPALDLDLNGPKRALLGVMGTLSPDTPVGNGLDPSWVSRSEAVVKAYRNDPLVHDRVTARLVRFMVDGGAYVRSRAPVWSMPTLLMWAGADRCVSPKGSAAFAAQAPAERLTSQVFEGMAHEIFNEPEREQPLRCLSVWLTERFG